MQIVDLLAGSSSCGVSAAAAAVATRRWPQAAAANPQLPLQCTDGAPLTLPLTLPLCCTGLHRLWPTGLGTQIILWVCDFSISRADLSPVTVYFSNASLLAAH